MHPIAEIWWSHACPAPGERNYHVFHQMLSGASTAERTTFGLPMRASAADYCYTAASGRESGGAPGTLEGEGSSARAEAEEQDAADWRETLRTMHALGLSSEEVAGIGQVLTAILVLGNIHFVSNEEHADASNVPLASIADPALVRSAARLFGVAPEDLEHALLHKLIISGRGMRAAAAPHAPPCIHHGHAGEQDAPLTSAAAAAATAAAATASCACKMCARLYRHILSRALGPSASGRCAR